MKASLNVPLSKTTMKTPYMMQRWIKKLVKHLLRRFFAKIFNTFVPNTPFLYPLKTPENRKIFLYFQEVEKGCIGNKRVNMYHTLDKYNNTLGWKFPFLTHLFPMRPFSTPLKTSENRKVKGWKGSLGTNRLIEHNS